MDLRKGNKKMKYEVIFAMCHCESALVELEPEDIEGLSEREIDALVEEEGRKIFGIMLMIDRKYETDPKVNISFRASESGPSGGLITALEMYNGLVKKDISNGMNIAGTGTIDALGNVGSIGGVRYKVIGADAGEADVFLVPKGKNYKEAMKVKKEKKLDIKIIGVSTLEEAVLELSKLSKQ